MLLEVKNRSPESWGPLAAVDRKREKLKKEQSAKNK